MISSQSIFVSWDSQKNSVGLANKARLACAYMDGGAMNVGDSLGRLFFIVIEFVGNNPRATKIIQWISEVYFDNYLEWGHFVIKSLS